MGNPSSLVVPKGENRSVLSLSSSHHPHPENLRPVGLTRLSYFVTIVGVGQGSVDQHLVVFTVRTQRSAQAFAFGARTGVRMTSIPSERKTVSKTRAVPVRWGNFLSRSQSPLLGRRVTSLSKQRTCIRCIIQSRPIIVVSGWSCKNVTSTEHRPIVLHCSF